MKLSVFHAPSESRLSIPADYNEPSACKALWVRARYSARVRDGGFFFFGLANSREILLAWRGSLSLHALRD